MHLCGTMSTAPDGWQRDSARYNTTRSCGRIGHHSSRQGSAKCHDLCQLSEASALFLQGACLKISFLGLDSYQEVCFLPYLVTHFMSTMNHVMFLVLLVLLGDLVFVMMQEVMRERLLYAICEGQGSFDLSQTFLSQELSEIFFSDDRSGGRLNSVVGHAANMERQILEPFYRQS